MFLVAPDEKIMLPGRFNPWKLTKLVLVAQIEFELYFDTICKGFRSPWNKFTSHYKYKRSGRFPPKICFRKSSPTPKRLNTARSLEPLEDGIAAKQGNQLSKQLLHRAARQSNYSNFTYPDTIQSPLHSYLHPSHLANVV